MHQSPEAVILCRSMLWIVYFRQLTTTSLFGLASGISLGNEGVRVNSLQKKENGLQHHNAITCMGLRLRLIETGLQH